MQDNFERRGSVNQGNGRPGNTDANDAGTMTNVYQNQRGRRNFEKLRKRGKFKRGRRRCTSGTNGRMERSELKKKQPKRRKEVGESGKVIIATKNRKTGGITSPWALRKKGVDKKKTCHDTRLRGSKKMLAFTGSTKHKKITMKERKQGANPVA